MITLLCMLSIQNIFASPFNNFKAWVDTFSSKQMFSIHFCFQFLVVYTSSTNYMVKERYHDYRILGKKIHLFQVTNEVFTISICQACNFHFWSLGLATHWKPLLSRVTRPSNFLTIEVFKELFHFDIFLPMDVLETFNFNHTKIKTILSSIRGINCRKYWLLDF